MTDHRGFDDALVEEAARRGYLTVEDRSITYHCRRNRTENYADPEERVRARLFSWLIIERSYSPERMDVEVSVPRRTPNDWADVVVYRDSNGRQPYLVVECKEEKSTAAERTQAIEQGFGNANSLRSELMLFDCGTESVLFDVANFPSMERTLNRLGKRDALPARYDKPSQYPLIANGPVDIRPVTPTDLETRVRRAHGLIWAGGKRDPLTSFDLEGRSGFAV